MKKVIITGASGFVGKALTKYLLDQEIIVYAIVRNAEKLSELKEYSNLHIVECEMSQYHTLVDKITERDFDACFHCAWEGMIEYPNDLNIQMNNVKYSRDLLETIKKIGVKKFVFADTIFQYKFVSIDCGGYTISKNYDVYGLAKQLTYKILVQGVVDTDIELNSVLIPVAFGVGDFSKRSVNVIIHQFLQGISPKLAPADRAYDCVYISDILDIFCVVADKGKNLKRYYAGNRKVKTLGEVVEVIRDIVDPSIELNFGTYHDVSFIDYDDFFNDDLYLDTGFKITSNFKDSILKTAEWVKTLDL